MRSARARLPGEGKIIVCVYSGQQRDMSFSMHRRISPLTIPATRGKPCPLSAGCDGKRGASAPKSEIPDVIRFRIKGRTVFCRDGKNAIRPLPSGEPWATLKHGLWTSKGNGLCATRDRVDSKTVVDCPQGGAAFQKKGGKEPLQGTRRDVGGARPSRSTRQATTDRDASAFGRST